MTSLFEWYSYPSAIVGRDPPNTEDFYTSHSRMFHIIHDDLPTHFPGVQWFKAYFGVAYGQLLMCFRANNS